MNVQQLVYHETSTYTCNTGYAVRGTTAQQCLKTKDVKCVLDTAGLSVLPSLPSDHCSSAPCGRYTPPANAVSNQIMNAGVHNDTIVGTCNSGYRAYVAQIWSNCFTTRTFPITCDDCRWQDAGATCKKVICNAPTIRNGFTSAQSSDFGNPITVTCNEGYRPDTSNVAASRDKTITCTDTCAHSPVFRCKPVSSTPSFLSSRGNASYIGLARWTGDLAVNETGTEVLESDGTIRISLSYGGRATFLCNKGYVSSGNLSKCTRYLHINGLADGTLRGADQYCKRVECNTDTVANAWYVQPSKIELGKNATVTCAPGYRSAPKGREFMSCADDNTYSIRCAGCHLEADMECVPVKCDTTYSIVLGNATQSFTGNYSKLLYGQTLAVRCSAGYRLNTHDINGGGFGVANCAQNCQLSGNLTCLPLLCDMTALPNQNVAWEVNGLFENGMYYGESGKMVCNAGYNADVDTCLRSFIVGCSSDGTLWNSDKTCNNPTKCTKPQSANAVISSNLSLSGAQDFGATATITCNFGYGAQTVPSMYAPCNSMTHYNGTCSQDCAFEGSMSCVPYRCPLSDLTTGLAETGSVNYSIPGAYAYYGDPVTITCNTGYSFGSATSKVFSTSAGCSTSQCGSFSTSGSSTLCIALTCDGAQLVSNSNVFVSFQSF